MKQASHILVVDDDPRVRDMLDRYLESEGFRVSHADCGEAMRRQIEENRFDMILLDVGLPQEDGLSLARQVRSSSSVPIIMVTGKGDVVDRVVGLEMGADDYIAKPFQLREVLARIRAVLRRSSEQTLQVDSSTQGGDVADRVTFAGWRLDLLKRELVSPADRPVALTSGEFDLLSAFVRSANRPLSRDQLMDLARGRDWSPYDRSIDTQVGRLRKKIEENPKSPELIKTVRGVGYIFTPKVER